MTIAVLAMSQAAANATQICLPVTVALASLALIGYLLSTRSRKSAAAETDQPPRQELDRAVRVAKQLESIAETLRHDLVAHHSQVAAFKRRLRQAKQDGHDHAREKLCTEADA
ncbi:MAG: hypothetical protein L0Z53_12220, partial [Acidobacteriales bacterium]|nr:hypothetical protein [Terriglobales bacterium]